MNVGTREAFGHISFVRPIFERRVEDKTSWKILVASGVNDPPTSACHVREGHVFLVSFPPAAGAGWSGIGTFLWDFLRGPVLRIFGAGTV